MADQEHNPLAFPRPSSEPGSSYPGSLGQLGMTLRDWFAGQALGGLVGTGTLLSDYDVADRAWDLADAMLERRQVTRDGGGQA